MSVCMHACMYVCMYACIYVCGYVCMYCMHACMGCRFTIYPVFFDITKSFLISQIDLLISKIIS